MNKCLVTVIRTDAGEKKINISDSRGKININIYFKKRFLYMDICVHIKPIRNFYLIDADN